MTANDDRPSDRLAAPISQQLRPEDNKHRFEAANPYELKLAARKLKDETRQKLKKLIQGSE